MDLSFLEGFDDSSTECPSDFTLDQLHLGHLDATERQAVEAHAAGCDRCPARIEARALGFAAFTQTDDRAILAALRTRIDEAESQSLASRLKRWWGPVLLVGVGAAAALLVTRAPPPPTATGGLTPDVTRLKGDVPLRVHRARGEAVAEVQSGDSFQAGDRLMFEEDVKADGHLVVFGVEASGAVYRAWPLPGQQAETLMKVGPAQRLPGAVALDATPGREVLHAVLCPPAVGVPECTADATSKRGLRCPDGCAHGTFVMVKP